VPEDVVSLLMFWTTTQVWPSGAAGRKDGFILRYVGETEASYFVFDSHHRLYYLNEQQRFYTV
jgi:hypothetical protein